MPVNIGLMAEPVLQSNSHRVTGIRRDRRPQDPRMVAIDLGPPAVEQSDIRFLRDQRRVGRAGDDWRHGKRFFE